MINEQLDVQGLDLTTLTCGLVYYDENGNGAYEMVDNIPLNLISMSQGGADAQYSFDEGEKVGRLVLYISGFSINTANLIGGLTMYPLTTGDATGNPLLGKISAINDTEMVMSVNIDYNTFNWYGNIGEPCPLFLYLAPKTTQLGQILLNLPYPDGVTSDLDI